MTILNPTLALTDTKVNTIDGDYLANTKNIGFQMYYNFRLVNKSDVTIKLQKPNFEEEFTFKEHAEGTVGGIDISMIPQENFICKNIFQCLEDGSKKEIDWDQIELEKGAFIDIQVLVERSKRLNFLPSGTPKGLTMDWETRVIVKNPIIMNIADTKPRSGATNSFASTSTIMKKAS